MIRRHARGVARTILKQKVLILHIPTCRKREGVSRCVNKACAESPGVVWFVGPNEREVVAAVVFGWIDIAFVNVRKTALGFGPSVADPAGKGAFGLFQKEFCTVGPAIAINQKVVRVVIDVVAWQGTFFEFNEVFHAFVIDFNRSFVAVFVKVAEVTNGGLKTALWLCLVGGREPDVGWQRNGAKGNEVNVLVVVGVARFNGAVVWQ